MSDPQFDVELHEINDGQETIKCGSIQLNVEKLSFSYTCLCCKICCNSIRTFAEHFQQHLVMSEAENEFFLNDTAEDCENDVQTMNRDLHDQSNSNAISNDEASVWDYNIEMQEDTNHDGGDVELLSNNENTEENYQVFQVHVIKSSDEEEVEFCEILSTNDNESQELDIVEDSDFIYDLIPQETLSAGKKIKKNSNYICEICNTNFAEKSTLKMHLQQHNRCQLCHTNFSTKPELKAHINTAHAFGKAFVCEECGQSFKHKENLTAHQQHHINKQLYLCNTCGKIFNEERSLREHIQTHTSARPFICKECNMTFSRQGALILHARMHTDIRKFNCTICRMTFAQNSGLLAHMKNKHHKSFDAGE